MVRAMHYAAQAGRISKLGPGCKGYLLASQVQCYGGSKYVAQVLLKIKHSDVVICGSLLYTVHTGARCLYDHMASTSLQLPVYWPYFNVHGVFREGMQHVKIWDLIPESSRV